MADKSDNVNSIVKNRTSLPVLPQGIVYLLKALNDNDIHYTKLASEIEKFPSIAIKIVAIANSPWSLPEVPISNLPDACSRIGLNIVRSVSIALSISQVFDPSRCPAFDARTYWISALLNAESASLCATGKSDVDTNTARLAGLLHNIGLLWLANQKPEETKNAILDTKNQQDITLADSLHNRLDVDYFTVGGQLALAMDLPDIITGAISTRHTPESTDGNPMIHNHCQARLLTAAVIHNMETENVIPDSLDENPHYHKLAGMLPKIQSMAESLFLN